MSSKLAELIEELDRQKQKYHEKLLSIDGEWTLTLRMFQLYDLMLDFSSLLIPEFNFSALSLSLLFGFDLTDLEPLNIEFTWRFPQVDEWLKGVGVVIERIVPEGIVSLPQMISINIKDQFQASINESRVGACVYGESQYSRCYVDPIAVREFLRGLVTLSFKKHTTLKQRVQLIESMINTLNINRSVARSIHDRISMVITTHTECFMLGYGVLGRSRLCASISHSPPLGVVPFINMDGNYVEAMAINLSQLQWGFILGVTPLGYGFLVPREDIYKSPPRELAPESIVPGAPDIVHAVWRKVERFRDRIMITGPAISNYVTGDEAANYAKSERTEIWGNMLALRYTIEAEVDGFLSSIAPGLNPFDRRKYITAVLQLFGHLGKRHRWGYSTFKVLEDNELRSWWLDYWGRQGLDINILSRLYDMVKTWLPQVVRNKVREGRSLRLQRLGLPL